MNCLPIRAQLMTQPAITMPRSMRNRMPCTTPSMADELRFVASNVNGAIVPHSGHWIMEENPQATIKIVTEFLAK
jgi:pimeloyl-ACP methyl ester carboxylesterase